MENLLLVLILGSGAMGLVLLLRAKWRRASQLVSLLALVLVLLAILLPGQAGSESGVQWRWIEEMDTVGLALDAPGIYLVVMAYGLLAITLARPASALRSIWLISRTQGWSAPEVAHPEDGPPRAKRGPPSPSARHRSGFFFLLCALVSAASTVDHFLARVVLLDMISLLVTVLLHVELQPSDPSFTFRRYVTFRVGDTALLLMIILLWRAGGTWDIDLALANAQTLPTLQLAPILLGGLLAVWIKLGLPPFHQWLEESAQTVPAVQVWLTGAGLPLLGTYLLYRIRPLLSMTQASNYLLIAGAFIALWALWRLMRSGRAHFGDLVGWLALHGAVGLMLAGTPAMRIYLLSFLPIRTALAALASTQAGAVPARSGPVWDSGSSIARPLHAVVGAAGWLEERVVGNLVQGVARRVERLASIVGRFEEQVLDGSIHVLVRGVSSLGSWLQGAHSGRLRHNLLWASGALFALAVASALWFL